MLGYVTIGTNDTEKSWAFYDAVLATIGWSKCMEFEGWRGYGPGGELGDQTIWVCKPFNGEPATFGNGMMVGLGAKTRDQVHAFYDAAMANGGSDEGGPGPRDYMPNWYSAYVRDPFGNKLSIVCMAEA